jgi:hypothetical protein
LRDSFIVLTRIHFPVAESNDFSKDRERGVVKLSLKVFIADKRNVVLIFYVSQIRVNGDGISFPLFLGNKISKIFLEKYEICFVLISKKEYFF